MARTDTSITTSGATGANSNGGRGGRSLGAGTVGTLRDNPVGALVGGFAVGAVLGAVIPAGRRERDALAPLGSKVTDAARGAARQAAAAGRDKLNRVTGEVVTQVGSKVVDAVSGATS